MYSGSAQGVIERVINVRYYYYYHSCLCKLSLQLIFVTLSWSTMIALSSLELAEEDCFGHAYVFHPCDVASLAQLHLKQDGLYVGQAGCL